MGFFLRILDAIHPPIPQWDGTMRRALEPAEWVHIVGILVVLASLVLFAISRGGA